MNGHLSELVADLWRRMSRRPLIFLRLITYSASASVPLIRRDQHTFAHYLLLKPKGSSQESNHASCKLCRPKHLSLANVLHLQNLSAWTRSSQKEAGSIPCETRNFHQPSQLLLSRGHRPLYVLPLHQASRQPCSCRRWDRNIKYHLEEPSPLQI